MPLNWEIYDRYFCGGEPRSQKPISEERKQALECGMAELLELDSHWRGTPLGCVLRAGLLRSHRRPHWLKKMLVNSLFGGIII